MRSTSVLVASILILLCFQISSKLKRMTLSPQKAKAVTQTSTIFFHLWLLQNISNMTSKCDIFCLLVDRSFVTQTHDITNPNYMGMSFQRGNVIDKGWSYSMPPKNVPVAGQGSKESKKGGYDGSTRSPTGKHLNPT